MDEQELKKLIKESLSSNAPGLYEIIDLACKVRGKDLVELLLEDPKTLRDILYTLYADEASLELVIGLVLKPLLDKVGFADKIAEYAKIFIDDPEKFKKLINEILEKNDLGLLIFLHYL